MKTRRALLVGLMTMTATGIEFALFIPRCRWTTAYQRGTSEPRAESAAVSRRLPRSKRGGVREFELAL